MNNKSPLDSEKFDLLSAYLDGEVSSVERQQVEAWLSSDLDLKRTYQQMLSLQNGLRSMPAVAPSMPTEQLVRQVMNRVEQQPRLWVWSGMGAAAAIALGSLLGLLTDHRDAQMAKQPNSLQQQPSAALMIALERPPVEIPTVPGSGIPEKLGTDETPEF